MNRIKRFNPSVDTGLSDLQIKDRYDNNLVNVSDNEETKTVKEIIITNTMTLFNIINVILAIAVILVGSFKNLTFIIVVIANTLISIFQEIRSKKTLDKLKVVSKSKVKAIRNGNCVHIDKEDIVLDDVLEFSLGNQVVVDSIILSGEVEVDESFITGESDTIFKSKGDMLLSGSFIVSGKCRSRVEHIGRDNYTAKIASDTKYIKPVSSEIMRSLNKIVSVVSFLLVPVGILLFSKQLYIGNSLKDAVLATVAALVGMIPEGLVLLTSTVLAVSVIRLSKSKVLVQDLYCIETLARVDVICLDKTGTITEGKMEVDRYISVKEDSEKWVGTICNVLKDDNPTSNAIRDKYKNREKNIDIEDKIPFSSSRKYSGICTSNGTYLLGAAEFLLDSNTLKKYRKDIEKYSKDYRVITLGYSKSKKISNVEVLGFVLLRDKIRKEAKDTLQYFKDQGVRLKIISGDDTNTVLGIAKRSGFGDNIEGIDATKLKTQKQIYDAVEKYDVFGRVTPEEKKSFVIALQNLGHTVAMTGDGVNDVLALKEADCSVAMASGADAVKNVSQLVLLDSNFASMPKVLAEGRRTINNIERSASLFLVKTIYATILSILFIFMDIAYPFIPIQLTLASVVTIGIPSFVLALEPNNTRVKGNFLTNVLSKSVPAAITIVLNIFVIVLASNICGLTSEEISTLSVTMVGYTSFILLYKISKPFNILRTVLFISMLVIFVFALLCFPQVFSFSRYDIVMVLTTIVCIIMSHSLYKLSENTLSDFIRLKKKILNKKEKS